ncbi:MAG: 2-phospho-L-lactate guanylyltransferase [Thermoleophilaceae bacterium]|nr:2-phospho-L-lactate guanylyltransferase [Thermoleophilaceae bacterium]
MSSRRERTCVILPVKPFDDAKERLATGLSPEQRRAVAEAMVKDVLAALSRAREVDGVVVISAEPKLAQLAENVADAIIPDKRTGHSDAARAGVVWAIEHDFGRVVMIPGDCPLLDPAELDDLIVRTREDRIEFAVIPDRMGTGTNALVISPPDAVEPSFGPGSRQRHIAMGLAASRRVAEHEVPSLALDLDTADDLMELAERLSGGDHEADNTEQAVAALLTNRRTLPGGYAR